MTRIYLSAPHLGDNEEKYVREAFATNWVSTVGPNIEAFERAFSERVGGLPCVALSSGTAAIHLGLKLLGVGAGDDVLCSTLTFAASANPIVYQGARPVFVDSDRASWNVDPDLVAETLEARARAGKLPKALIVVHLYGQSADLDRLEAACERFDVPILEDAAEALGTHYRGEQVGQRAPLGVFSFNGNKIITTSGGGMLVTRDRAWAEKARYWATQARQPVAWYEHEDVGFNYRMSNVLAGIGRGQLEVLEERVAARRANAFRYRDAFADCPGIELMPQAPYGRHTNWLSVFLLDEAAFGASRDELLAALAAEEIEGRPVWKPLHAQPVFASAERVGGAVAEDLFARGICLPSSSNMTSREQERVIDVVRRVARTRTSSAGASERSWTASAT
ncbi:MAG: DegT/DnrJ/EryC1/StrS family aminotransferase [Labilithrix sp.]|nr:DegT/DnrJ/EryC1/StrS family aminotransferase [Labilithrix sp.]MCW5833644.1 DegT/DnrJ/EryC1/StrS family aminotransferase [Labilithrix sp.]